MDKTVKEAEFGSLTGNKNLQTIFTEVLSTNDFYTEGSQLGVE